MTALVNIKEIKTKTRARASRSRRNCTNPLGIGILGVFLMLALWIPTLLGVQTLSPNPQGESQGEGVLNAAPEVQTYDQLVAAIRQARAASKTRVEQAVRQEKVRECWETGKLIDEHVLQHKERADYGKQVIARLATDLGTSQTELSFMLQFARAYPIHSPANTLSWAHYRELLALNDSKEMEAVAKEAAEKGWGRDRLREEIKKRKAAKKGTGSPAESGVSVPFEKISPVPQPGKPGTYRIVRASVGPETGKGVIDLGFSNYYRTSKDLRFKEEAIVEVIPAFPGGASAPSDKIKLSKRTSADLYTYRAWVVRVLDGDTLKVVIDLGFGVRSVQTLRLRGLDCPELVSKEGQEAKEFAEKMLGMAEGVRSTATGAELSRDTVPRTPSGKKVLIKTIKSDKYDRYLADIFIPQKDSSYLYLNNELLEKGFAVAVRE